METRIERMVQAQLTALAEFGDKKDQDNVFTVSELLSATFHVFLLAARSTLAQSPETALELERLLQLGHARLFPPKKVTVH